MATETVRFQGPTARTLTADIFPVASDTAAQTGRTCTEATNAKGWYTFTITTGETGLHRVVFKESGTGIGVGWCLLTGTAVTVETYDDYATVSKLLGTLAAGTHTAQSGDAYAYLGANLGALGANATEVGGTGDHLTDVTATLANGAHGGASASFTFGAGGTISNASGTALTILSSGGNGNGVRAVGNGSGSGVLAGGGATGHGAQLTGGVTSGNGLSMTVLGSGVSIYATSNGIAWNSDWDTEVESEVNDALVAVNLDHLMKTATAGADMTTEVSDNTVIARMLANGDTSAFDPSTDGLQPIRDENVTEHNATQTYLSTNLGALGANATEAGGTGDHLTAVPWNAAWDAEVQSEAEDALVAQFGATAITGLAAMGNLVAVGTVQTDAGNTASTFKIDTTLGAKSADYFGDSNGGLVLAFLAGTTNEYQSREVSGFNTTTDFITVQNAFSAAPTNGEQFALLGRIQRT